MIGFIKSNLAQLESVWRHPLNRNTRRAAIARWLRWKISVNTGLGPVVVPYVGGSVLVSDKSSTSITNCVFFGLGELGGMGFFLHALRPGDLFCDVGANVGVFTVLASAAVRARTIAFEPVPATFAKLDRNIRINNICDLVEAVSTAVGSVSGRAVMTSDRNSFNHIVKSGDTAQVVDVPLQTLDTLLNGRVPTAIKLDVEGFEMEVLYGARQTLSNTGLKMALVEVSEYVRRYGESESAVITEMGKYGFHSFLYDPVSRTLSPQESVPVGEGYNLLFIRDLEEVTDRIRNAPRVSVNGVMV